MQRSEGLGAKAPNKEDQHSAEGLEGSGLIEENVAQSHTGRRPRRKAVSQGLDGVRQAAKKDQRLRFTALLHHITEDLLRRSFYSLRREAAAGVDEVTWQEYETGLKDRIIDLHKRVQRGVYRAQPA